MAVPTQLSDLSATASSNSPAGGDTVGTTMDDYLRAIQSIIVRISAGTDALATPALGAATGTSLVLSGLATVNGAFTSLGLDDNATAKALTLSGSGANSVTIANSATNPTIGTSAGSLTLSAAGVQGLLIAPNAAADTYAQLTLPASGNNYVALLSQGSGADVGMFIGAKGTAAVGLYTAGLTSLQVAVVHTASANRYITLTGSNGGNPTIGTSAGSLAISSALVLTGALTIEANSFCKGYLQVNSDDATPAGGNTAMGLFLGSSAIGIFFGSGAPDKTAPRGSLYLRTDNGANTSLYVNRDGGTTWAAVTSA